MRVISAASFTMIAQVKSLMNSRSSLEILELLDQDLLELDGVDALFLW